MEFIVGMLVGMVFVWAAHSAWQQTRRDGWERLRGDARHLKRFYEARDRERQRQG